MAESGVLVVVVEVGEADADDLNRWYDEEHIPEKLATPGFRSARRYRDTTDPGRFMAVYELDDVDLVTSPGYMAQAMSPWTEAVMATWVAWDRSVWTELTPSTGGRS